jgi:hypothetical protein
MNYHNKVTFFRVYVNRLNQFKVRIKEPGQPAYEVEIRNYGKGWMAFSKEYRRKILKKLGSYISALSRKTGNFIRLNQGKL